MTGVQTCALPIYDGRRPIEYAYQTVKRYWNRRPFLISKEAFSVFYYGRHFYTNKQTNNCKDLSTIYLIPILIEGISVTDGAVVGDGEAVGFVTGVN